MSKLDCGPNTNNKKIYVFIDGANFENNLKNNNLSLDQKTLCDFNNYLCKNYGATKVFYFIGRIPECHDPIGKYRKIYDNIISAGYEIVFKDAKPKTIKVGDKTKMTYKGNVDCEMTLWAAAKKIDEYDQAIIISGDGDFGCLLDYLEEKKKLMAIFVPKVYAKDFGKFASKIINYEDVVWWLKNR